MNKLALFLVMLTCYLHATDEAQKPFFDKETKKIIMGFAQG